LIKSVISDGDGNPVADIGEAKIGIPTIEILKALDGQIPDDVGRAGTRQTINYPVFHNSHYMITIQFKIVLQLDSSISLLI